MIEPARTEGDTRRAALVYLVCRGVVSRPVELGAEGVSFQCVGDFGGGAVLLEAGPDGTTWNALAERRASGTEFIVAPPRWLRVRAVGGRVNDMLLAVRLTARLR